MIDTDNPHGYGGGYTYLNIPSLAVEYVSYKEKYRYAIDCRFAAAIGRQWHALQLHKAKFYHQRCNDILYVVRSAGKMDVFLGSCAVLQEVRESGGSYAIFKEILNRKYGVFGGSF